MRQEIKIFRHEMFGDIRTMINKSGETFFVGKDVAEALDTTTPVMHCVSLSKSSYIQ